MTQHAGVGGTPLIVERNALVVILLSLATCGIYGLYWLFKTSDEIRAVTGDEQIKPGLDLLLCLVTCGFWAMYVQYRNVQKVHQVLVRTNPTRKDQSQTILILLIAQFFVGVTGFIAMYLAQEEYNALARG